MAARSRRANRFDKYLNKYMSVLLPPPPTTSRSFREPPERQQFSPLPTPTIMMEERTFTPLPPPPPRAAMANFAVAPCSYDVPDSPYQLLEETGTIRSPRALRRLESVSVEQLLDLEIKIEDVEEPFSKEDREEEFVYSCCPPKLAMIAISLVEVALFAVDAAICSTWREGPMAQTFMYNPLRRREVWRFLTYMLVHTGVWHLSVNVFIQLMLGVPLEMAHSWWCVLIVYSSGVIAGSLGSSITNSYAQLAGASGGVYALITAHIVSVLVNWKKMNYPLVQLCAFLVIICADLGVTIVHFSSGSADNGVSYAAHLFGGVAGLLVGAVVLKTYTLGSHEKIVSAAFALICLTLVSGAVIYNVVADHNFPSEHR